MKVLTESGGRPVAGGGVRDVGSGYLIESLVLGWVSPEREPRDEGLSANSCVGDNRKRHGTGSGE